LAQTSVFPISGLLTSWPARVTNARPPLKKYPPLRTPSGPVRETVPLPPAGTVKRVRLPALNANEHLERVETHFGPLKREPAVFPPDLSFVFLCFTNRSGSNFLAELLASGGAYNRAGEILNWDVIREVARRRKLSRFQDVFADTASRQQKSGHFFVKMALAHLEMLVKSGVMDQIRDRTRFVLLERNDKLAQAISYAIAFATRGFTSEIKTVTQPHDVEYSRRDVDRYLTSIGVAYRSFAVFFGRNGIVPLHVTYERLIADPESEAAWLARELGLPDFVIERKNVRLERQSGGANEEWRRRYLSEGPFADAQ
jgi:LPS sulfotransferase NodH